MLKRVCLCGSTRFGKEIKEIEYLLTANGIPHNSFYGTEKPTDPSAPLKKHLIGAHRTAIDESDVVYVVNPSGYAGLSVATEIGYARGREKAVYSSEPFPDFELGTWIDAIVSPPELVELCKGE